MIAHQASHLVCCPARFSCALTRTRAPATSIRNRCEAYTETRSWLARKRNLTACHLMINLIIVYNHDDSIAKLKNMFGENMGGLNGSCSPLSRYGFALPTDSCAPTGEKLEAARRGRVLGASGGCGFSSLSFGRAVLCLVLFRDFSFKSFSGACDVAYASDLYLCCSERTPASACGGA
jgi:hypothetical protein